MQSSIEERAEAATLFIVGRFERVMNVTTDCRQEQPQVPTTVRMAVEFVRKGNLACDTIEVKVTGGKTETEQSPTEPGKLFQRR
jgi:hypothetical protein